LKKINLKLGAKTEIRERVGVGGEESWGWEEKISPISIHD
jgi:hypothetical protein